MPSNKEKIQTDILIDLESGKDRATSLATTGKRWQTSIRTFDRHWKIANEIHRDKQQAIQNLITDISTTSTIERLKSAILDKNEALEILTKLAKEETKLGGMGLVSAKTEQISAIKTIAELEGWNEPIKTADVSNRVKTKIKLSNGTEIEL